LASGLVWAFWRIQNFSSHTEIWTADSPARSLVIIVTKLTLFLCCINPLALEQDI